MRTISRRPVRRRAPIGRRGRTLGAALALAALAAAGCAAAEPSDPAATAEGRDLALEACGRCHVVAPGQAISPAPKQPAPSFPEIANGPQVSGDQLAHFVTTPHWDEKNTPPHMSQTYLTDSQSAAVVSYILSLRKAR